MAMHSGQAPKMHLFLEKMQLQRKNPFDKAHFIGTQHEPIKDFDRHRKNVSSN